MNSGVFSLIAAAKVVEINTCSCILPLKTSVEDNFKEFTEFDRSTGTQGYSCDKSCTFTQCIYYFWFYFSTSAKFPDQLMPQRITSRLIQNSSNTLSWVYSEQVIIYETSVYSADMHQNPNQLYWPSMCRFAKNGASFSFFFCSHSIYPNKQTYNSNLYSTFIFIYTVVHSAKMLEYNMEWIRDWLLLLYMQYAICMGNYSIMNSI